MTSIASAGTGFSNRLSSVATINDWITCGIAPKYEAESPDELALVKAATKYGYVLLMKIHFCLAKFKYTLFLLHVFFWSDGLAIASGGPLYSGPSLSLSLSVCLSVSVNSA